MLKSLLALGVAVALPFGTPSAPTPTSSAPAPLVVTRWVEIADPCRCQSTESVSVTFASGTCTKPNSNPPVQHPCFTKTESPAGVAPVDPNGRCYVRDYCPLEAVHCQYTGYKVKITSNLCEGAYCCSSGVDVTQDGTAVGGPLGHGNSTGDILVTQGAKKCGSSNSTSVIAATCTATGDLMFEVTVTFRCGQCTAARNSDG